jgi:hypothetical protein
VKPKVVIGHAYQRRSYEWRNRDGQYQALRPAMGRDAELLQAALLGRRASFASRLAKRFHLF